MKFRSGVVSLNNYLHIKNKYILISFISVLSGFVLGVIAYIMTYTTYSYKLSESFIKLNLDYNMPASDIFSFLILSGLPYFITMYIVGGSIFGKLCPLITAIKSMGISFITSFLYCNFGLRGFEYALLIFFPGKILLIIALLLATKNSIEMNDYIVNKDKSIFIKNIMDYNVSNILIFLLSLMSWLTDLACHTVFLKLFL